MGLQQIKKIQIGDQVYEQMRSQIIEGFWKPGDRIPSENDLMKAFDVSRVTVRQAIQKLAGEGLIKTRRGEGSFVLSSDIDSFFKTNTPLFQLGEREIREIFDFRTMFESGVVEAATEKTTEAHLQELEDNYRSMKAAIDDVDKFVELDLGFHRKICAITENTLAIQIFQSYETLLRPSIEGMVEVIGTDNGVKYHALIIDALKKRDADLARETMIQHLKTNVDLFEASRLNKV